MTNDILFRFAYPQDAENLSALINDAYRGTVGWTKETALVEGNRISLDDVHALIQNPNHSFLLATQHHQLVACVCIEKQAEQAYIGTFAVHPAFQNQGLGKQVLTQAENYAMLQLGAQKLCMVVISQREELIAFYERRGYQKTGHISDYPVHLNVGMPVIEGLTIEQLEKQV